MAKIPNSTIMVTLLYLIPTGIGLYLFVYKGFSFLWIYLLIGIFGLVGIYYDELTGKQIFTKLEENSIIREKLHKRILQSVKIFCWIFFIVSFILLLFQPAYGRLF